LTVDSQQSKADDLWRGVMDSARRGPEEQQGCFVAHGMRGSFELSTVNC